MRTMASVGSGFMWGFQFPAQGSDRSMKIIMLSRGRKLETLEMETNKG